MVVQISNSQLKRNKLSKLRRCVSRIDFKKYTLEKYTLENTRWKNTPKCNHCHCPKSFFYLWPLNIRFLATRPPAKHGLMNVYGFTLLPRPPRKLEKSQRNSRIHFIADITQDKSQTNIIYSIVTKGDQSESYTNSQFPMRLWRIPEDVLEELSLVEGSEPVHWKYTLYIVLYNVYLYTIHLDV